MDNLALFEAHKDLEAVFNEKSLPKHYGHPIEEYEAVRKSVGMIDLSFRDKLTITGEDQCSFLQRMITNDIVGCKVGEGIYAAILTVKGKMLCDMKFYRHEDYLFLDLEPGLGGKVTDILMTHKFMADIQIENMGDSLSLLSLHGPKAKGLIEKVLNTNVPDLPENAHLTVEREGHEVLVVRINRTGEEGYDIYMPSTHAQSYWDSFIQEGEAHQLKVFGLDALEILRIEAGIPIYGVDMTEATNPFEARLDHALDFKKGCYVGQETIARMKWQGHANWFLMGYELEGEKCPAPGDSLFNEDKKVGTISSSTYSPILKKTIAMGRLRKEYKEPGTSLTLDMEGSRKTVTVTEPPFYKPSERPILRTGL
ncbi:MAG: aminomethyltransferase [bacterium]|nr:MAG: aminomethyltransferase [bacterium]